MTTLEEIIRKVRDELRGTPDQILQGANPGEFEIHVWRETYRSHRRHYRRYELVGIQFDENGAHFDRFYGSFLKGVPDREAIRLTADALSRINKVFGMVSNKYSPREWQNEVGENILPPWPERAC